jgi:nicotinate-nucleotide adenylyltransferase
MLKPVSTDAGVEPHSTLFLLRRRAERMQRAIGVLGGSFDPIHHAHLAVAHEAAWVLGLERVLLLPAAQQPLKMAGHGASAEHRLAMVELACGTDALLQACDLELRREGPSYTFDTLRALRAGLGAGVELYFILGADALRDLPRWYRAADLPALCRFAVIERPGVPLDLGHVEALLPALADRLTRIVGPRLDIAGTELRRRIAAGMPVRYQLPDAVLAYIREHALYQPAASARGKADR